MMYTTQAMQMPNGLAVMFATSRTIWLRDGRASNGALSHECTVAQLQQAGYHYVRQSEVWRKW